MITGTFIDEISHDIPHQNWGPQEWKKDFRAMKEIGIDTVILIRCGYKKWMTYDSPYLQSRENVWPVSMDLVELFLGLAEEEGLDFYFGLYDSGKYWWENQDYQTETEINLQVAEEVWSRYGSSPAFKGWYLNQEISRLSKGAINLYDQLGKHCKDISSGLPVMISPYIDGSKAVLASDAQLTKKDAITLDQHEQEWNAIFKEIKDAVDIVAFQDGQVPLELLSDYLRLNKELADYYGMQSWSNIESFDRDMPIKFLPIKWDKLKLKMEAAKNAGMEKLITFEFSHFMSPHSAYGQAHHLYNRYKEYLHGS